METIKESGYRYSKRDAAFRCEHEHHVKQGTYPSHRDSFNAGWKARKEEEYKAVYKEAT
jgi:hypothetical protein